MDFYYGTPLLARLQQHYESRMALALEKGFDKPDAKFHWLYVELEHRVMTVRRLTSMLQILPEFMCRQTVDQVFTMVIGHTSGWFSDATLGEQPRDEDGHCIYYRETNPFWVELQVALDRFTNEYDYKNLASFYVDLTEYVVRAVRLYFFIRERQFKPIDRDKYEALVGVQAALATPA